MSRTTILAGVTPKTVEHQTDAAVNQANPTQNVFYVVLDTAINARIIQIMVNIQTTDETLEIEMVVDGKTLTGVVAATAGVLYGVFLTPDGESLYLVNATDFYLSRAFFLEGRSIRVRIRKTTATGAGNLQCRIKYALKY